MGISADPLVVANKKCKVLYTEWNLFFSLQLAIILIWVREHIHVFDEFYFYLSNKCQSGGWEYLWAVMRCCLIDRSFGGVGYQTPVPITLQDSHTKFYIISSLEWC